MAALKPGTALARVSAGVGAHGLQAPRRVPGLQEATWRATEWKEFRGVASAKSLSLGANSF